MSEITTTCSKGNECRLYKSGLCILSHPNKHLYECFYKYKEECSKINIFKCQYTHKNKCKNTNKTSNKKYLIGEKVVMPIQNESTNTKIWHPFIIKNKTKEIIKLKEYYHENNIMDIYETNPFIKQIPKTPKIPKQFIKCILKCKYDLSDLF